MTQPCDECDFQANSARQLSRHKAVKHNDNPLSCVLCPFVTAYQTNLLRHRREVHGILGSKGNKSCKFCGFEADDNETLFTHQEQAHQDILKSARERFAKEKKSARGDCDNDNSLDEFNDEHNLNESTIKMNQDNGNPFHFSNILNGNRGLDQQSDDDDDKDFWKEGFIDIVDNPSSFFDFNQFSQTTSSTNQKQQQQQQNFTSSFLANFQKQFQNFGKLISNNQLDLSNLDTLNGLNNNLNALNCFSSSLNNLNKKNSAAYQEIGSPESEDYSETEEHDALNTNENNTDQSRPNSRMSKSSNQEQSDNLFDVNDEDNQGEYPSTSGAGDQLAPTKIRRQYSCTDCDFRTVNPREFLYHRRDIHNQKVKIVECPYCVYACQYFQKLQRHMLLVHKLETSITPPTENSSSTFVKQQTNMVNQLQGQPMKKDFFVKKTSSNKDDDQVLANYSSDQELTEDNDNQQLQQSQQFIYQKSKSSSPAIRRKEPTPINHVQKSSSIPRRSSTTFEDKQFNVINGNKQLGPTGIKCKYCQFQTDTFSKLEKHENTYHLEKRFRCPFCEIKFENLVWLQRHLLHMHQNNEKAKQILETIDLISTRRKRVKTNHNSSNNNNNSSNNSNSNHNSSVIDNNQPSATVEFDENGMPIIEKDSTKCTICSYETKWFSELQKHMRVHTNEKPFSCQLCSFKTKWKGDLNRHINKYHAKAVSELKDQGKPSLSNGSYNNGKQSNKRSLDEDDEEEDDEEEDDESQPMTNNYLEYQNGQEDEYEDNSEEELTMNNDNLEFQNEENDDDDNQDGLNATDNEHQQLKPTINNDLELPSAQRQQPLRSVSSLVKDNLVKVYKCSHCDFICSTASRFHVHFVQHLNTKPFMCSACETRSTWSWDIRKHIRMKKEKGETDHENATALLVHHSGNRDYKKYDKYLILINKNDIDNNNSNHQQDKRGLIDPQNLNTSNNQTQAVGNQLLNNLSCLIKNLNKSQNVNGQNEDVEDKSVEDDEQMDYTNGNNLNQDDDQDFNAEDIVITPDITFSIGNEMDLSINQQQPALLNSASALSSLSNSLASSLNYLNNNHLALNSNLLNNSTCSTSSSNNTNNATNKLSKLFYCAYCDYTHRDSKSLVSHLSQHAGKKPFKCRICGFSSNWREVLNRHVSSRHAGTSKDIEQLFRYSVCKYICRIKDENGQANPGVEITTQETIKQANAASNNSSSVQKSSNFNKNININDNSLSNSFQDLDPQNSLMMINSILAQQLSNCDSMNGLNRLNNSNSLSNDDSTSIFSNLSNLTNLSTLNLNKLTNDKHQFTVPSSSKPKTTNGNGTPKAKVETPEVLAAHGITGRVSGFKGEFKCTQCPFRAEKAFHMDFHTKRHVQMPGADFKCQYCDFWVHAKKSLVKHVYLHKYENVSPAEKSSK